MADLPLSPWANGHSIEILRQVSAGLVAEVANYQATQINAYGVAAEWVVAEGVSRDALLVYRWLLEHLPEESAGIAVAGDSAGAGLAVTLAMDTVDQRLRPPVCVIANSPYADLANTSPSLDNPTLNLQEPNKITINWLAATVIQAGEGCDAKDPRLSPVYRDLRGLAPLLVQVAGQDNLQDDGVRLAQQAMRCGVTTELTRYPNAGHIWSVVAPADASEPSAQAVTEAVEFIRQYLPR